MVDLEPTQADYMELLRQNPLAAEQLKVLVLRRMYGEAVARIEVLQAQLDGNDETPTSISDAAKPQAKSRK